MASGHLSPHKSIRLMLHIEPSVSRITSNVKHFRLQLAAKMIESAQNKKNESWAKVQITGEELFTSGIISGPECGRKRKESEWPRIYFTHI